MGTEVTKELMNEVIDARNAITGALYLMMRDEVKLHHRATSLSPSLYELHIDFETDKMSVWMVLTQDKKVKVHRDMKERYQRDYFEYSFEEALNDINWLKKIVLEL